MSSYVKYSLCTICVPFLVARYNVQNWTLNRGLEYGLDCELDNYGLDSTSYFVLALPFKVDCECSRCPPPQFQATVTMHLKYIISNAL